MNKIKIIGPELDDLSSNPSSNTYYFYNFGKVN